MSIDRQKAIHRPRRVIFNDDNAPIHQETATTPEGYYAYRLDHVIDTHVDSVWISIMTSADNLLYNTNVGEVADSGEWPGVRKPGEESVIGRNLRMLIEQGTDPLQLVIDFCRKHDLEILASFRTNMIQDSWWPNCRTQWKRDHPELCLGDTENPWTVRGSAPEWKGIEDRVRSLEFTVFTIYTDIPVEPTVTKGENSIDVTLRPRASGLTGPVDLVGVELFIRYR